MMTNEEEHRCSTLRGIRPKPEAFGLPDPNQRLRPTVLDLLHDWGRPKNRGEIRQTIGNPELHPADAYLNLGAEPKP